MSNKVKSVGMAAYVAIGTNTTFVELCTMDVSGGGVEATLQELEPCLNETTIEQIADLPKDLPFTLTYKKLVGTTATTSDSLEAAVRAGSTVKLGIKYPLATPIFGRRDCQIISHDNDAPSRPNYLTCTMSLIGSGNWTYSTTAPAT